MIYKITNSINGKVYIGQTRNRLSSRWRSHKSNALKGVNTHFYRALRKYGVGSFSIEVVISALKLEHLNSLEIHFISQYDSFENGYNSTTGGVCPTRRRVMSLETRKKMSKSRIGNKNSLGVKHSDETKRKVGLASRGNSHRLGKRHSLKSRKKISENHGHARGRVYTPFGIFNNTVEASKILKVGANTVSRRCNNTGVRWVGWSFEKKSRLVHKL